MAKKQTVDDILRKNLGNKLAGEIIRNINKMIKAGKSPEKIQQEIIAGLFSCIQDQVTLAVVAKAYPGEAVPSKLITEKLIMLYLPCLGKVQGCP